MPEREWYEFDDPASEGLVWRIDVTFLSSRWNCIYGRGCHGILETPVEQSVHGCCSFGAYFSGDEDRQRVQEAASRLTGAEWQYQHKAKAKAGRGIGRAKTPVVDGACLFLNRGDFPGGSGCALHLGALARGENPIDWKPDVCWQLPLRFREEEESHYVIEEFTRATWGEAGGDFGWWCTDSPEAHDARQPVWRTMETELRKMMGDEAYEHLAGYLSRRRRPLVAHPADR